MRRILLVTLKIVVAVGVVAYWTAWAGATIRVTREENKPDPVEVAPFPMGRARLAGWSRAARCSVASPTLSELKPLARG